MNRNPADPQKRLFRFALVLGATATMPIPEVAAAGSARLELSEGARAKLRELAAAIAAERAAEGWANLAWPAKGAAAKVELETLASILGQVEG